MCGLRCDNESVSACLRNIVKRAVKQHQPASKDDHSFQVLCGFMWICMNDDVFDRPWPVKRWAAAVAAHSLTNSCHPSSWFHGHSKVAHGRGLVKTLAI